ncbi:MAG: hypothetical protein PHI34_03340, partial [Acidobacteriota bacterium]|nr:hypothetical protein [Acidobacteriota bacterium]
PGDKVVVRIKAPALRKAADLRADLLVPGRGVRSLAVRPDPAGAGEWTADIDIPGKAPEGFYAVTVSGPAGKGRAAAKASWLVGRAIGDFFITSGVDASDPAGDIERCLRGFMDIGGNLVVVHDNINGQAWYPSALCAKAAAAGSADDRVGKTLDLADRLGLPVMLSVVWDMTRKMPGVERWASQKAVMAELLSLYAAHPCLMGFYDYQEGSGTYFAAHVREFSDAVKTIDRGLLAACAPYLDDPLLAGYLAAIPSLDIAIYQGAFEASYRPDNRKNFPVRRTRDFAALSAGAMRAAGKIALSHVELFGYLERRSAGQYLATPEDAFDQIASAAACGGPDGITLFTWHYNVHRMGQTIPAAREMGMAVAKGLEFYRAAAGRAAVWPGDVTLYIPYSDWWTDRWSASIVPALDALRTVGIAADIEPFIPPAGEEILPFYPYGMNEAQLAGWLERKTVLVLADISGMQDTDSALLKAFVEKGGTALLFGPHIPYADLFDREALVGGKEKDAAPRVRLVVREAVLAAPMNSEAESAGTTRAAGAAAGRGFPLGGVSATAWTPMTAKAAAVFEDGAAAVLVNAFGKGTVITCPLSLKETAAQAPGLLLDVIDSALLRSGRSRAFDWQGVVETMDVAQAGGEDGAALAATHPGPGAVDLVIRPRFLRADRTYDLTDLQTGESRTLAARDLAAIRRTLRPHEAIALSLRAR